VFALCFPGCSRRCDAWGPALATNRLLWNRRAPASTARKTPSERAICYSERASRRAVQLRDVGIPRLDGLGGTRRIREQPWGKAVTIIALTGWGRENDRERSREAGCDDHLVKPVSGPDRVDFARIESVCWNAS
jgi:CheY-like chemotaxis protein